MFKLTKSANPSGTAKLFRVAFGLSCYDMDIIHHIVVTNSAVFKYGGFLFTPLSPKREASLAGSGCLDRSGFSLAYTKTRDTTGRSLRLYSMGHCLQKSPRGTSCIAYSRP